MQFKRFPLYMKVIVYHGFYLILHYLYDWFPNSFTRIISGVDESIYQHMKIGFFAAIILVVLEYAITGQSLASKTRYWYSRIFMVSFLPLAMLVTYLFSPLVFVQLETIAGEIIFANLALLATSFSSFIVERQVAKSEPDLTFRAVVVSLFVLSLAQYIVFTYRLPWFDGFANPPGWECRKGSCPGAHLLIGGVI